MMPFSTTTNASYGLWSLRLLTRRLSIRMTGQRRSSIGGYSYLAMTTGNSLERDVIRKNRIML